MSGRSAEAPSLGAPLASVVRELVRTRLEEARAALIRLGDPDDARGLHDFRVALRRVRSLLDVFSAAFAPAERAEARRRLRRIGAATGGARDAEAQRDWLREQLGEDDGPGLNLARAELERTLAGRRATGYASVREQAVPQFLALWSALPARRAHRAGRAVPPPSDESFGRASGRQIAQAVHDLEQHLDEVRGIADETAAHEARICAKRLRYILEPLIGALPAADGAVQQLRALQDVLGELNDLRALRALVRSALEQAALARAQARLAAVEAGEAGDGATPGDDDLLERGCLALARALERRRRERFAELTGTWRGPARAALLRDVHGIVQELLDLRGAHTEIERRYLLSGLPALPADAESIEIAQGYLGTGSVPERLRRARSAGDVRYYRTVKIGRGAARIELEQAISAEEFERLWPGTHGCRVYKRRHRVPAAQGCWEIDEFTDRTLVLAELELPDTDTEPELPDWLAPAVLHEVTDDPSYTNLSLARRGA
jgi:CHAD domain-containing protein/CYTH domain-containing protein